MQYLIIQYIIVTIILDISIPSENKNTTISIAHHIIIE